MNAVRSGDNGSSEESMVREQLRRVEKQLDELTKAVIALVRVEERQMTHGRRLGSLETDMAVVFTKIQDGKERMDTWINRGIGAWAVMVVLWSAYRYFFPGG